MNKRITLEQIAGYCHDQAIWKLIADLASGVASKSDCLLSPAAVIVDGNTFLIDDSAPVMKEFRAPECIDSKTSAQAQQVWSIGAIAHYASSGRILFGGNGSNYQHEHPEAPLPVLQKKHQALTPLVQRCLCHDPSQRISLQELANEARCGLERCSNSPRQPLQSTSKTPSTVKPAASAESWPEEMTETR